MSPAMCKRCTAFKTSLNVQPEGLEKKGRGFWSEVCLHGDQKGKVSKKATLKEGRPVVRVVFHPVYAACMWRCAPYVASVTIYMQAQVHNVG